MQGIFLRSCICCFAVLSCSPLLPAQNSGSLGNGLSAAAIGRAGNIVSQSGQALDAMEGNPAGAAGITARTLEVSALGIYAGGSFHNAANPDAKLTGLAGALPYGAFAIPFGPSPWVLSVGFTPEILMRANWHYNDRPGTAGVTYGYQRQETQIIAVRSSVGLARTLGPRWSAGVSLGIAYNANELNAPYIFQQQPEVKGLKVLLGLTTQGYGWNGSAGSQWLPTSHVRAGLAWKSGTTLQTHGDAHGTASALFAALGLSADPSFHYQARVLNRLPQAFDAGFTLQAPHRTELSLEGDLAAWAQAFQQLPIRLTDGTNVVINSVVGLPDLNDAVPLHWRNQSAIHAGLEQHVGESAVIRAGYSYATNPVPGSTLTPLTAAIMQQAIGAGGGWSHARWHYDVAYQAQLPSTRSVDVSGLEAGEYNNSRVRVWTQSITLSTQIRF